MKRKLLAYSSLNSPTQCGRSYEKRLNILTARLNAKYTVAGVIYVPGSGTGYAAGDVVILIDGGKPSAQIKYDGTSWSLVNIPLYSVIPSTTTFYDSIIITTGGIIHTAVDAKFALIEPSLISCLN